MSLIMITMSVIPPTETAGLNEIPRERKPLHHDGTAILPFLQKLTPSGAQKS